MELELLKKLVEIESYVDRIKNKSEITITKTIVDFFSSKLPFYKVTRIKVENSRENLLILPRNPKIIFCCHLDTVLPSKKNHNKLTIKEDKAFGLGTKDMKGGWVSSLLSVIELSQTNREKVGFLFYCDEEYGQKGMETMLSNISKIPRSVKYFICPESRFNLTFGCRGYSTIRVTIHGLRAHTSRPQQGVNSGEIIFNVYKGLQKRLKAKTRLGDNTISLTGLKVGVLVDGVCKDTDNSIPDYAEANFSIRLSKAISKNELNKKIVNVIKKNHKLGFDVKIEQLRLPSSIISSIDLRKFINSAKKAGYKIKLADPGLSGYNDVAMISSKTGIPFLGFGPYGEGNHGPNEWVSLKSIKDTKEIFKKFIENI